MDIYYSYACRDSYLVYAWLKRVQETGKVLNLRWHPFAIQIDNPIDYWKRSWDAANSELRGFIAAEAAKRQGDDSFARFHDALETAVYEQFLELGDEAILIRAAQEAGLDLPEFQADWHDPQLPEVVLRSHEQAVEQWNVFGTPTVVFPNGRSVHIELNNIPSDMDALEILQALEALDVTHPYVRQMQMTSV